MSKPSPESQFSPEAVEAMRAALENPVQLSADEEAAFLRFRSGANIRRFQSILLLRRGHWVWRLAGRKGADLPCSPAGWESWQALRAFQKTLRRLFRQAPNPAIAAQARKERADARAQPVLAAYEQYRDRGRDAAALTAKKTGEPVHYVRRVLRESARDAKS